MITTSVYKDLKIISNIASKIVNSHNKIDNGNAESPDIQITMSDCFECFSQNSVYGSGQIVLLSTKSITAVHPRDLFTVSALLRVFRL